MPCLSVPTPAEGKRPAISTDSIWGPYLMSDYQFRSIMRAMFVMAGAPQDLARPLTIKSMRKFLPSGGENLFLPLELKAAIGNWVDNPKASAGNTTRLQPTMSQLYSAGKIPRAHLAKNGL